MFFGLTNSPATFQTLMNTVFGDLISAGKVAVYLLIFSDNLEQHREVTKEVLQRLREYDLYLRPEKCEFEKEEVEYLGLIIWHAKVEMDRAKVKVVEEWPVPGNLREVQGSWGLPTFIGNL
jgi:hypothetical protein